MSWPLGIEAVLLAISAGLLIYAWISLRRVGRNLAEIARILEDIERRAREIQP